MQQIKQVNLQEGRRYEVAKGVAYPSITTVLGKTKDITHLLAWKKRVGEAAAQKITTNATTRGTKMHDLCERFLLNQDLGELGHTQGELLFKGIRPELEKFNNIRALETGIWSNRLQVAGTVDCIAEYEGVLSIIDFKTSSKEKKKEWIEDYFLQGAFYFNAFFELSNEIPKQIVILIALEDGGVQKFILTGKEIIEKSKQLEQRIGAYYANQTN